MNNFDNKNGDLSEKRSNSKNK